MRRAFPALIGLATILVASSAPAAGATLYSGASATRPEVILNVSGTRVIVDNVQLACRKPGAFTTSVASGRLTKDRFSFKIGDTFVPEPLGPHTKLLHSELTITGAIRSAGITGTVAPKGGPCVGGHYHLRASTITPPTTPPPATPPVTSPPTPTPITPAPAEAWDPPPAPCNAGDVFAGCGTGSNLAQHHCISNGGECDAAMCATATDMAVTGLQITLKNAGAIEIPSFDPAVPEAALIGPVVNAALEAHGAVWLTVGSDNAVFYCGPRGFEQLTYELDHVPTSLSLCVGVTPSVESVVGKLTGSALAGASASAGLTTQTAVDEAPAVSVQGPDGWSASVGLQGTCLSMTLNTES